MYLPTRKSECCSKVACNLQFSSKHARETLAVHWYRDAKLSQNTSDCAFRFYKHLKIIKRIECRFSLTNIPFCHCILPKTDIRPHK